MVVYEGNHRLKGRASSACAKYADAFLRISLAWRSSRISRSIALIKARSSEAQLILRGHSSESICFNLGISLGTVKTHRKNAYAKLEISSQSELLSLFLHSLQAP